MRKKIVIVTFFVLYAFVWINHEMLSYAYMQAKGQLEILYNAVPIKIVLDDTNTTQSTRDKILLMQEVRQFAIDSIGLSNSDNYTSFYDQKEKEILWNLSACEPYEFKAKQWRFPMLGTFSYKGFFDLEKAKLEREKLDALGLDTRIRTVSAWSTLGWFSDPILSNMLKRNTGSIAELITHELTHSTIFVKDSLTYNESLASFIGEQGALLFLISKYGKDSKEYKDYRGSENDYIRYTQHMMRGFKSLDSLYNSFSSESENKKFSYKQSLIKSIVDDLDTVSFHHKKRFATIFSKKLPNNATFQSYERYNAKVGDFETEMNDKFTGNLFEYVAFLKSKWE